MGVFNLLFKKIFGDVCPTCRKKYKDTGNIMMIENIGECGMCDHVRGEVNDDRRADAEELDRFNIDPEDFR